MCGVVGYIGKNNAVDVLIDGLTKLEYRGYDSAGIATISDGALTVTKTKGRVRDLEQLLQPSLFATIGMGHTRWATHGEPSYENAHPHVNQSDSLAVIHNGIVENYIEIKSWLIQEGVTFKSDTDTEVIVHLIDYYYKGDLPSALREAVSKIKGAYAIGVLCKEDPHTLLAYRKDSPLLIGLGQDENFIASDVPAILKYTKNVIYLDNDEMVVLTKDSVTVYDEFGQVIEKEIHNVEWDAEAAEKEGYEHFTLKEINEQPQSIADTISRRIDEENDIVIEGIRLTDEEIRGIDRIYISACGTAYYAGLIGRRLLQDFTGIPVICEVASEFKNNKLFIDKNTLFIAVTQSGETIDTLMAMREAKYRGARALAIVNVVGSSIAREADDLFYTWAGPEIAVASTKAYTSQIACFYMLSLYLGKRRGLDQQQYHRAVEELKVVSSYATKTLLHHEQIQRIAATEINNNSIFFIGRGIDSDMALEASLKFKELTYINSFAVPAGELKHGTIALIEEGSLVVVFATDPALEEKVVSNIREVKARGAHVISIVNESLTQIITTSDESVLIPSLPLYSMPLIAMIPAQLFAYYMSTQLGNDVDKPRNLAKSVTVE